MAARVRKYAGLRHLIVLLTACCLFLSGCGAKLSDSGTIPSVTIAKDTPFTLEVSTEEVQKRGMRVDGLTVAIQEQLQTAGGVEAANGPGPGTLAVCFDDHGSHGCCPDGGRRAGDCGGGRHGLMNSACCCIVPSAIAGESWAPPQARPWAML